VRSTSFDEAQDRPLRRTQERAIEGRAFDFAQARPFDDAQDRRISLFFVVSSKTAVVRVHRTPKPFRHSYGIVYRARAIQKC
jgi:hypothetical protein